MSKLKIGVIGVNGTGKSTFLKIMAGAEIPEEGDIQTKKGLIVEYLPQDPVFDETDTILGQVLCSDSSVFRIVREYEEAVIEAAMNEGDERVQRKLMQAASAVDAAGGWQLESEAKTVLTRLGITDLYFFLISSSVFKLFISACIYVIFSLTFFAN